MYEIVDNFLDENDFGEITDIIFGDKFPWFNIDCVTSPSFEDSGESLTGSYMVHMLYDYHQPHSEFMSPIYIPFSNKDFVKSLVRVKVNLYPNNSVLEEHNMHVDYDWSHKGAIFSLNTCDGYTKLEDGTKIQTVANRMLFFDSSKPHCSTNTTDARKRANINFNYF